MGPTPGRDVAAAVDITTFALLSVSARTGDGHPSDGEQSTPAGGMRTAIASRRT